MEPNRTPSTGAATDEPALPATSCGPEAGLAEHGRHRHDGWTPERMRAFLETLAACGVVADACRAAGMSAQSAYALRNRRAGRAFAEMWDAVLIHRARARMEGELMSRALDGYVERIEMADGNVRERHRYDNRLSLAMLARLDRLAESASDRDETLRALSEDFEEFLDTVEDGGDADEFVVQRRPAPPSAPAQPDFVRDDFDMYARLTGCSDWRDVPLDEIPVADLDPDFMGQWEPDQFVRAGRSHYLDWLAAARDGGTVPEFGSDCPAEFERIRAQSVAGMEDGSIRVLEEGETEPSTSSTSAAAHTAEEVAPPGSEGLADADIEGV